MFRDRVIIIKNSKRGYILGQVLHRENGFDMGYSRNGTHYIALNGGMLV